MNRVKIGFVGVGFMGQLAHLRNYVEIPGCEVVALAEPRKDLARRVAERYDVPQVYPDHKTLLAECPVDAVVASQPYERYAILIPEILDHGVAVFTEKPAALTVKSAEKLASLAEEKGLLYMVGYHKRSDPAMEFAANLIRQWRSEGRGPIRFIRATMPPGDWIAGGDEGLIETEEPYPDLEKEPPPEDMDQETFRQYDEFVNYYIHQVNALRFLLGEPYRVVYASASGRLLVGESSSGVPVTLEMAPYTTRKGWEESYLVGFEHGTIRVDLPAPLDRVTRGRVEVFEKNPEGSGSAKVSPDLPDRWAMRNQAARFVEAVRTESPPPCSIKEAVEDLRLAVQYIELKCGC